VRRAASRLGPVLAALAAVTLGPAGLADAPAQELAEVTGTSTYLDRAMVPPGAELTVVLRDVSSADASAEVLAATTRAINGAPPYPFVLRYDAAVIDAGHTYTVRARVTLGDRLLMTTDTVAPVITRGALREVTLVMHRVPGRPAGVEREQARPALDLPASFTGTLPAASGPGIDWHLDLWPDGVFHLRQDYLGSGGTSADIGPWHHDPRRGAIVLRGGRKAPVFLAVTDDGDLRLMDRRGAPIESDLPYTLAAGPLDPAELALPLTGMVRDMADAAHFADCLTGRRYPVAMEGASPEIARAYIRLEGVKPGVPVLAVIEGRLAERPAMAGPDRMHVVAERFARLQPDRTCAGRAGARLTDTYWRILEIGGTPVHVVDGRREPHLILRTTEPPDVRATVGCNTLRGGYDLDGEALTLDLADAATTMMACPAPLAARERAVREAIAAVTAWRVDGEGLALLDRDGSVLLAAEAVHFH
jgi:copper homeostasis protein (lipoprotein)